ncbi:MAG: YceI family protein [Myxococcaceae bacterium]
MRTSLLILCIVALAGCPDPAKDKSKATVAPATKTTAAALADLPPLANATAFTFSNDGSTVAFTGAKVTGKHEGGFKAFKGALEVVENDLTKSRVRVDLEMGSVFSDSEKLTGHLKSPDFFGVEQFPVTRFVSTSLKKAEGARYDVTGDLTLHGVTKSISFPADITLTDAGADVTAEFALNRKDFGIVYPGKPDDLIADNVLLKLSVHAKK